MGEDKVQESLVEASNLYEMQEKKFRECQAQKYYSSTLSRQLSETHQN